MFPSLAGKKGQGGGTHNSCAKGQTKSAERWPCQQLLTPIRARPSQAELQLQLKLKLQGAMSGRFNQMGKRLASGRQTGQEQTACVAGLTIGEISSKTIKN